MENLYSWSQKSWVEFSALSNSTRAILEITNVDILITLLLSNDDKNMWQGTLQTIKYTEM